MSMPGVWPHGFDREQVRAWLEEATGAGISVDDALPDTLIAIAQSIGVEPVALKIWIYDQPRPDWSASGLTAWARRLGFAHEDASPPQEGGEANA